MNWEKVAFVDRELSGESVTTHLEIAMSIEGIESFDVLD